MEVWKFVKASEVEPSSFESSYYMRPTKPAKSLPPAVEALPKRLRRRGPRSPCHNREHIVVLRPGPKGILPAHHVLSGRIRQWKSSVRNQHRKRKRAGHGKMLIDPCWAEFEPRNTTMPIVRPDGDDTGKG